MTPKERVAMQQALEAIGDAVNKALATIQEALAEQAEQDRLKAYRDGYEQGRFDAGIKQAEQEPVAWMQDSIELYVKDRPDNWHTIPLYTAPQPDFKALWEKMCKRCDELDSELAKYTETEPVAIEELAWKKYCEDTAGDMDVRDFWEELPESVQQRYIAKVSCSYPNCNCPFDHPGGDWCARGLLTNAAPVRTKDLTDDEIEAIMVEQGDLRTTAFARAVIVADREKNK